MCLTSGRNKLQYYFGYISVLSQIPYENLKTMSANKIATFPFSWKHVSMVLSDGVGVLMAVASAF